MKMKNGVTLIEMLVVIAIIGILAGVMMVSFSGGTESARAAQCLSNMRSLAQGVLGAASSSGWYPAAGSYGTIGIQGDNTVYGEVPGWISWFGQNDPFATRSSKNKPTSYTALKNVSAYCEDEARATFALTNGTIWTAVNCERDIYKCPAHVLKAQPKGVTVRWSYVMNARFGYDYSDGSKAVGMMDDWGQSGRVRIDGSGYHFDRMLLFAELPILGDATPIDEGGRTPSYNTGDGQTSTDCVLQYKASYNGKTYNSDWSGRAETIAYNHKSGKKFCAHVVFADGHTEKLLKATGSGLSDEQLTALLCEGKDVTFNGRQYSMATDGDK